MKEYIMNIFILDENPEIAAQLQCDKHVVKMVLESAQMLSTAHRVLDGKLMEKHWLLPDGREDVLYRAVHINHPCTRWVMESVANYRWLFRHFSALSKEYYHRYGKHHKSWVVLNDKLREPPYHIPSRGLTPFRLAMGAAPHCIDEENPVKSYRKFYQTKQDRFDMKWTSRDVPEWFKQNKVEMIQ